MPKVISLNNYKGGSAKTFTSVNLAVGLANKGYKVLLIDNDPQGNASYKFFPNFEDLDGLNEVIFDSKDIKVIFFARTSCGYCQLQKPILKNVAKDYDLEYFNIDTDELSETEVSEVMSALGIGGSTPNTVVVKEGKVLATSNGYLDGKAYVKYLVKNGVLKEGSVYKQEKNLKEIDYSDFKKIAKEDKASLVFLDTSACQACTTVRSLLNEFADDNDFEVYYLNSYNLTEDDVTDLVDKRLDEMGYDEEQYKEDKSVSVPLLLVVKDNKIKDYILKSTDETDYKKLLKKYDFIK